MSFAQQRFLGLTVIDFTSSIGWNDEGSRIEIKLAPEDGESIESYIVGNPYNFSFGQTFKFNGILERVLVSKSTSGTIFTVTLTDGKEILRNVEVITSNFYGWKETYYDCLVTNLLNPYRYYEAQQFGSSLSDESGMLISKFCEGVKITSGICGIIHKGIKYSIDLSNLINIVPPFYRINSPNINLLDAISQICDDAGYNFFIYRDGLEFKIKLSSLNSGGTGQNVDTYIESKGKERDVISWSAGVENANNVVSNVVLYGGNQEEIITTWAASITNDVITSFWGYHPLTKEPIKGRGDYFNVVAGVGGSILWPVEWIDMPTLGVEDITGSSTYLTSTLELQMVIGGKETWELWLEMYKPGIYAAIYLRPPRPINYLTYIMTGGAAEGNITREFLAGENDIGIIRSGRFYNWLKSMVDGFWGKQFLSKLILPIGVRDKVEGYEDQYDPNKLRYNATPTDSGFLDPTDPFVQRFANFNDLGKAQSQNEEGKTLNWVIFDIPYPSFSFIGSSEEVITNETGTQIAVKATLADKWVWIDNEPYFHLTISQPAFELQDRNLTPRSMPYFGLTEEVGYPRLINVLFGSVYNTNAGSSVKFKSGPIPLYPTTTLTAIRSDYMFYGPWISYFGNGGKVKFEQDNTITPWAYGSRQKMHEISSLRVADDLSFLENVETGEYTKLGLPEYSLGDELIADGPRVTGISISYNSSGINTNYSVRTFTPKFGFLPKQTIDNVKRLAQKTYASRRFLLKQYFDLQRAVGSLIRTFSGAGIYSYQITATLGKKHDRSTPHSVLLLQSYNPKNLPNNSGADLPDKTKTIGGFTTVGEAQKDVAPAENDQNRYDRSVAGSVDQLFRPFTNSGNNEYIPKISLPDNLIRNQFDEYGINSAIPSSISYNPLKESSDIDLIMNQANVNSWDNHNFPNLYNISNTLLAAKGLSFKGPMMLTGWGTAITGDDQLGLVPNKNQIKNPWYDGKYFKTGPIDLVWDEVRGVWTSHDVVFLTAKEDIFGTENIPPNYNGGDYYGGLAYIQLGRISGPSGNTIAVINIGTKDILEGEKFIAHYDVYNNRWIAKKDFELYRFWEECASDDVSRGGDGEEYYWDFDIQKNVDDPGYGNVDEGYCTDILNKVSVIKTNGLSEVVLIPRGTIGCEDGSDQNVFDKVWFWHGLAKEVIPWEDDIGTENDPCANNTTVAPPTTTYPPTTTTQSPAICLYYDSTAEPPCYFCQRCDTPPDDKGRADGERTFPTADDCSDRVAELSASCPTTTLAPGCYLTEVTNGETAVTCWQCIPAQGFDSSNPTYGSISGQPLDCDDCANQAEELNSQEDSSCQGEAICLYAMEDNPLCYYCDVCDITKPSLGNFTGADKLDACTQVANTRGPASCVTTTTVGPTICMYYDSVADCYLCQRCDTPPGGNYQSYGSSYSNIDQCTSQIDMASNICTTTTLPPGCYLTTNNDGCYVCTPAGESNVGTSYEDCDACQSVADSNNQNNGSCTTHVCLFQDPNNELCYYCAPCDEGINSLGSYYGATAADDCQNYANQHQPASCNTTTTTLAPTTTQTPTTTQNPNCIQVVSSVSCGENGLSVTYTDVAKCGVSQVYQTDFQTTILRAEIKSLKRQLSDIYTALEKHGIKINNA